MGEGKTPILIIFNPVAGRNKKNPEETRQRLDEIIRYDSALGYYSIMETTRNPKQYPGELIKTAKWAKGEGVKILGISGGDGTILHVLTNFIDVYGGAELPMVLPLEGGTINNLRMSLGMKGSQEDDLSNLVMDLRDGKKLQTKTQKVLKINDGPYSFTFGYALPANGTKVYYDRGNKGVSDALKLVLEALGSRIVNGKIFQEVSKKVGAEVYVERKKLVQEEYTAFLIGTVRGITSGFYALYDAERCPDKFHLLADSRDGKKIITPGVIWKLKFGKPVAQVDMTARESYIEFNEPTVCTMDGELYELDKAYVRIGRKIEIIN